MFHRILWIQRPLTIGLMLTLVLMILSACGTTTPSAAKTSSTASSTEDTTVQDSAGTRTITDELGHTIVLPDTPTRIFAPYLEDSLLTLGVTPVAQWASGDVGQDYLQDQLGNVPKLDFSSGLPSAEMVMNYNPDLIVLHTANYAEKGVYESYSKIAPVYVFKNASGEPEQSLEVLGELLNKKAEAATALDKYHAKVEQAKQQLSTVIEGKKAAIIRFAPRGVSLMGGNYFSGYVVYDQLGLGKPKLVEAENSAILSTEVLPDIDADYIFTVDVSSQGTNSMAELTGSSVWKTMPAVQAGHVFEADASYWLGGGLIAFDKVIDDVVKNLSQLQ